MRGKTSAMKTPKVRGITTSMLSQQRMSHFTLRRRSKKDGVIQGKLRMRSMPGVFLVLGAVIVVLGTALAVAGYWPYQSLRSSILQPVEGESISEAPTSEPSLGAEGLLSTTNFIHSERMKLLGPVIMGVGLFILICANAVLYENRDRETQILLAQLHNVVCSVSAVVPSADLKEIAVVNSMTKHYRWMSKLPAAHLNVLCLNQYACSEPLLQTKTLRQQEDKDGYSQQEVLQTEALHHQKSELQPSQLSSNSCNYSETDLNTESGMEPRSSTRELPLQAMLGLNNYLMSASSMSVLVTNECCVPVTQPRRCHSMSYRTKPHRVQPAVRCEERFSTPHQEGQANEAGITSTDSMSQICRHMSGHVLDAVDLQIHQSWPGLDLNSGRKYPNLENKEESVEKLLEHSQQQWDKGFGSGPF
ncbi:uncharacterized protein tmem200b isoform X2 [Thalassophryne amazonica]|nr:uncharacterized protein tmem200b isoform X2 [Thalassophryne amazonica]